MFNSKSRENVFKTVSNSFLVLGGVIAAAGIGLHVFGDGSEFREIALELDYVDEQYTYPVRIPTETVSYTNEIEGSSARAKLAWYGFIPTFLTIWLGSKALIGNRNQK
jgi:hypothetical protein